MSTKESRELIRRQVAEFAEVGGDVAKIRSWCDRCYGPGLVCHEPDRDFTREQLIDDWASWVRAVPDMRMAVNDMVAEGDKVVVAFTLSGTQSGELMGAPATGKKIVGKTLMIFKIGRGKIVEIWEYPDMLGLLTQLGAVPSATPKK